MSTDDLKKMHARLEQEIAAKLCEFSRATGLKVAYIRVDEFCATPEQVAYKVGVAVEF